MKTILLLLCFFLFLEPGGVAAGADARSDQKENRYLFVLDTSVGMARASRAAQQAVAELIQSGVEGRMRAGDTFGIWLFNQELSTEFPMQRWSPQERVALAQRAHDFLSRVRYEKQAQFSKVMPVLKEVIEASRSLTVILISDGKTPMSGTPFDEEINEIYRRHLREVRDARLAFVTFLAARDGKIEDHSVNSSLGPMRVPPAPPEPEVKPQVAQAPPPPEPVKRTPPPATPIAARSSPVARTNPPPALTTTATAQITQPEAAPSQPATNRAVPAVSQPAVAPTETRLPVAPRDTVPAPAVVSTTAPPPAVPAPVAQTVKAEPPPPPLQAVPTEKKVEPEPVPEPQTIRGTPKTNDAVSPLSSSYASIQSNAVPAEQAGTNSGEVLALQGDGTPSGRVFAAVAAFLVFAAGFAFLWLRKLRQNSQPSLISRSMRG
jgi:hypothetical protein